MGIGLREGVLLGANLGRAIVTNGDFTAYVCDSSATRPSSQITLRKLVIIITVLDTCSEASLRFCDKSLLIDDFTKCRTTAVLPIYRDISTDG